LHAEFVAVIAIHLHSSLHCYHKRFRCLHTGKEVEFRYLESVVRFRIYREISVITLHIQP